MSSNWRGSEPAAPTLRRAGCPPRPALASRLHRGGQILPEATGMRLPLTSANLLNTFKSCRGGKHDQNPFLLLRALFYYQKQQGSCLPPLKLFCFCNSLPGKSFPPMRVPQHRQHPCQQAVPGYHGHVRLEQHELKLPKDSTSAPAAGTIRDPQTLNKSN